MSATSAKARHADDYSRVTDHRLAHENADYAPTHCFRGRHAHEYDFAADEAAWCIRCIEAYPLLPWPEHAKAVAA